MVRQESKVLLHPSIYNLSVSGLVSVNKQKPTHCLCNHLIDGLGGMATHPIVSSSLSMVMVSCSEEFESGGGLFFLEKVEDSIIMKMLGIDVIFGAYITLHNKVLVVLLYLNHSKLGEISLLMS